MPIQGYDEWEQYHLDELETELCLRHRYNPHKEEGLRWMEDQVLIKMEKKVWEDLIDVRIPRYLLKKYIIYCSQLHNHIQLPS